MKVTIDYKTLTDYAYRNCLCSEDFGEYTVYECEENGEFDVSIENVELDREDLEEIVDLYRDEILEILEREERKEERKFQRNGKSLENWMG